MNGEHLIFLPLSKGHWAIVDSTIDPAILAVKWSANCKDSERVYAYRTIPGTKRHEFLHHRILGVDSKKWEVDHKNGITCDNRLQNLRACLHFQNGRNMAKWGSPTSSRFKGVSWHKQSKRWRAYIVINNRQKYLGSFEDEIEAAKAYDRAAVELFGEYARLNFPKVCE